MSCAPHFYIEPLTFTRDVIRVWLDILAERKKTVVSAERSWGKKTKSGEEKISP